MSNYGRQVEVIQCPFDRSHMLRSHRIQYHIVKCRKNYKGKKVACPFNASEYIEPDNMIAHLGQCSYRVTREVHFFYSRESNSKEISPPFLHGSLPESNEDWGMVSSDEEEVYSENLSHKNNNTRHLPISQKYQK